VAVKRSKYDAVFSQLIRLRDEYTCQVCGKSYESNSQGLHCSHFYSRRHQNTRYDPLNACAKCYSCHQKMGGDPVNFTRWIRKYLGDTLFDELHRKHNQIKKWGKGEKEEMYQHYRSELKRLEQLRAEGEEGVLTVVPWE